jgi:4-diphosphocytidyl-2-C-methyl-D-erythritol kinase
MRSFSLLAPAKINLELEIIGDRSDGYHELVMIMQTISLCDRLDIYANGTDRIRLHCNHGEVPLDESNLAYKAAKLMQQEFPEPGANFGGLDITIEKSIPVAAGLAGGSSNAAAVLVGINQIWKLGLTVPELQILAGKLGSDIPFSISGGTAIATGRGEQLDPIHDLDNLWVILAKHRNLGISTPWAYNKYRQEFGHNYINEIPEVKKAVSKVHSGPLVKAISHQNGAEIGKLLHNDLEKVVLPAYPQVAQLRDEFQQAGVLGAMMSGSGPTVFALCETENQAREIKEKVQAKIADSNLDFWVTKVCSHGVISAN